MTKQLKDRRRRKRAFGRVTDVVTKVVARAVSKGGFWGLLVDGLRDHELPTFEAAVGCRLMLYAHLSCPKDVMMARLGSRQDREGDDQLGLAEMDDASRVRSYLERADEEAKTFKTHAEKEPNTRVFIDLDATQKIQALVDDVVDRLTAFAQSRGENLGDALTAATPLDSVDWNLHMSEVASQLDQQFHPDGKPRDPATTGCESEKSLPK